MQKFYCFVEAETKVLENFLAQHDEGNEIYLYSSVIAGCEDNLFYGIAQIVSHFWENTEKCILVTDIPELYNLAEELCGSLYEKIIYLEQGVTAEFSCKLEVSELLDFSYKLLETEKEKRVFGAVVKSVNTMDLLSVYQNSEAIRDILKETDWRKGAFWCYLSKLLFMLYETGQLVISTEYRLFFLSLQMKLEQKAEYTNWYLEEVQSNTYNKKENYYFVWNQFKNIRLRKLAAINEKTVKLLDNMYESSFSAYKMAVQELVKPLSKEERNKNRVLVMTIQFLGEGHAPTRTVMERCKALKKLGKEVYLINTSEQYTAKGYVPMFDALGGTVQPEYDDLNELHFDDEMVCFHQMKATLSLTERFYVMADLIKKIKPYYILSIGSGSMLADLCGKIVPCASMALAFSTLPHTMNRMKILGRTLREEEKEGLSQADIIESRFTFEFKEQKKHFTRRQWDIPEECFLLTVVGIRLDYEITEEFLKTLESVCAEGCFVVFAGNFEKYAEMMKEHAALKENSQFIGYCDDVAALMEISDLYVNPKRLGGGFSVIEAFEKGVPGVYLKYGDVYTAGGEEFATDTFDEMKRIIIKYKDDREFYHQKSENAKKRAKFMTSSVDAIAELDKNISFKVENEYW